MDFDKKHYDTEGPLGIPMRRLLFVALPIAMVLGLGAWLLWPRTMITQENADKIQPGMTLAEVEAILGGPARQDATGPIATEGFDDAPIPEGNSFEAGLAGEDGELIGWDRRWFSDTIMVTIHFDLENHVSEIRCRPMFPVERGMIETLRRWLHL
jgi:hypothetical protein